MKFFRCCLYDYINLFKKFYVPLFKNVPVAVILEFVSLDIFLHLKSRDSYICINLHERIG